MLTLNDGRAELWQWDTGRTLSVDADCSQVHFSNKVFGRSIDVDVTGGVAIIPDILLQTDKDLNVWAFVGTSENGYTKISKTFKVNRRNRPADYVFTPTDQTSLEEIKEKIDYLESIQDPDAIKNAVEDYLEKNPVEAPVQSVNGKTGTVELTAEDVGAISDETDPTVPAWAKQPTKPTYTAGEVGALSAETLPAAINTALAQAKDSGEFDGAPGENGNPGAPGADGYSPTASVTQTDTGAVITITDKTGTTTATLKNGTDGQPGQTGATPNIQIGTVETLAAGSPATASVTGTPENPILNLGIPQGASSSGGGIAVSGATVGQTVKISAVDDNGMPTAWEPVDFPSGGGEKLVADGTKIATGTIPNGTEAWSAGGFGVTIGDLKKWKKFRIMVTLGNKSTFDLAVMLLGVSTYICNNTSNSGTRMFYDFEWLDTERTILGGYCTNGNSANNPNADTLIGANANGGFTNSCAALPLMFRILDDAYNELELRWIINATQNADGVWSIFGILRYGEE